MTDTVETTEGGRTVELKSDQDVTSEMRQSLRGSHRYTRSDFADLSDIDKAQINGRYEHGKCWDCICCELCTAFGYCSGIKCCCCHMNGDKPFLGVEKRRICTDVPCCVLFLAALGIQFYIFYLALIRGADPNRLLYFANHEGNLCAPDDKYPAGNYAAWPDIRLIDIIICVNSCNETTSDPRMVTPPFEFDIADYTASELLSGDFTGYESTLLFNAYCIPNPKNIANTLSAFFAQDFTSSFDNIGASVELAINDILTCRYLFIVTAFVTLLLALIWGRIIRHFGGIIIWTSILFTIIGVFFIAYYLITYSGFLKAFGYDLIASIMYWTGVVLAVLDGLFTLAICFMWNRIRLALRIVKEATRSLSSLWQLFFYPIVPFFTFCAYFTYWVITGIYIGSVIKYRTEDIPPGQYIPYYDSPVTGPTLFDKLGQTTYQTRFYKERWQYALLFHFFVLLWVSYYISYHTYLVVCGVYAEWYFADWEDIKERKKKRPARGEAAKANELTNCPVWNSYYRTTKHHMGTIAFASLLIAIVEFVEYTLTYFEKKFLNAEDSPLKKCVLCLLHCLLKCLKCILNRINKNGLTITAVYGWPFCAASIEGILIVMKNIIRASAMSMVSGYLEKLGGIAIVALTTGIMMTITYYIYGDGDIIGADSKVTSLTSPGIVYFIISLIVTGNFMHLYEVGLRTIFICFLIDEQRNKHGYMKASKELREAIGEATPKRYELVAHAKSFRGDMINTEQRKHFAGNDNGRLNYHDYKVLRKSTRDLPLSDDEIEKLKIDEDKYNQTEMANLDSNK